MIFLKQVNFNFQCNSRLLVSHTFVYFCNSKLQSYTHILHSNCDKDAVVVFFVIAFLFHSLVVSSAEMRNEYFENETTTIQAFSIFLLHFIYRCMNAFSELFSKHKYSFSLLRIGNSTGLRQVNKIWNINACS